MSSLDWISSFEEVGRFFRLGMEAFGSVKLRKMIDLLVPLLPELSAEAALKVQELLVITLAAQERKDYLQVADCLEYEVAPLLQRELSSFEDGAC